MVSKDNVFSNVDKRLFYLSSDIDNSSIGRLCFDLLFLLQQDDEREKKERDFTREPIKIYINSFGGSVYDMWALIDIMLNSQTPIYTYCTGYAMSAGFEIFLAGHKRYCTNHATFLCHQISSWIGGRLQDIREEIGATEHLQEESDKFIRSRTKIKEKMLKDILTMKLDRYIYADEALELGIVDEIMG